jgi:hypothetical protein
MKTEFLLLARYERETVPLHDICSEYLGLTPHQAVRAWNEGRLPVKAFRLRDSTKAPLLVHLSDLAKLIDEARAA